MVSRPRNETELVRRVQAGDKVAFAELIKAHQNVALRLAWLLTGGPTDAEEAVQNSFVKAFYAFDRFAPGAPVRPWLLRIVANEAREGQDRRLVAHALRCGSPRSGRQGTRLRPRRPPPWRARSEPASCEPSSSSVNATGP